MDPSRLIPSAEAIPAPWWLLEFLTVLTLTLHLLLINVALGGRLKGGFRTPQESTSCLLAGKIPTCSLRVLHWGWLPCFSSRFFTAISFTPAQC